MKRGSVSASWSLRSSVSAVRPVTETLPGSTSRTSAMATEVSRSAGPVVGIAEKTMVLPSAEVSGSLTEAM